MTTTKKHFFSINRLNGFRTGAFLIAALAVHVGISAQGIRMPGASSETIGLRGISQRVIAPSSEGLQQADSIAALVNSEPITHVELKFRMQQMQQMLQKQGSEGIAEQQLRKEALDSLIAERLLLQRAKESGGVINDYVLDRVIQNVAEQNSVTVNELYRQLAAENISRDQYRKQIRNQVTLMRMREQIMGKQVKISEREVEQFIRDYPDVMKTVRQPDSLNLGHVLLLVPENANQKQIQDIQAKAEKIARELASGRDFAQVAKEHSDAPEGKQGGALGLRSVTQYPELFARVTSNQPAGAVVGPFQSPAGFHFLKVLDREQGKAGVVTQSQARHILITPSTDRSEQEVVELLEQIRKRVTQGGEDFALFAQQYSTDKVSAAKGGDLGWSSPGMFVPEFQEVVDMLQPNEISPPAISRFGVHLIQLLGRREHTLTKDELRELARSYASEAKSEVDYKKWLNELRSQAYIEIRDAANVE